MNGKSLVLLALALVCGLGAMYGTNRMLAKDRRTVTQDVLVAVRDLKVEELIKPDMVKVVRMSNENLPPGTFTSFQDVEDRWVQVKILQDEPIVDRKLAPKGSPAGLVARIPEGKRAFALEVNEQTGVSGFVLPDHRVDVIHNENNPSGKPQAETILEDVLVLASGTIFTRPEDRSIQSRTVTLAVTPDEVDILVAAKSKGGQLALSLRGVNDHKSVASRKPKPAPPPTEVALAKPVVPAPLMPPPPTEPKPAPPPAPPDRTRYVMIYRGIRQKEKVPLNMPPDEDAAESETAASPAFPPLEKF
jgi:pilus assembly protein CpaB